MPLVTMDVALPLNHVDLYLYKKSNDQKTLLCLDTLYVYCNIFGSLETDIGDIVHRFEVYLIGCKSPKTTK